MTQHQDELRNLSECVTKILSARRIKKYFFKNTITFLNHLTLGGSGTLKLLNVTILYLIPKKIGPSSLMKMKRMEMQRIGQGRNE